MTARENPIGLDGFEFVEWTSPDAEAMGGSFAIEPHRLALTLPAAGTHEQPVAKSR